MSDPPAALAELVFVLRIVCHFQEHGDRIPATEQQKRHLLRDSSRTDLLDRVLEPIYLVPFFGRALGFGHEGIFSNSYLRFFQALASPTEGTITWGRPREGRNRTGTAGAAQIAIDNEPCNSAQGNSLDGRPIGSPKPRKVRPPIGQLTALRGAYVVR
jgi:hypothetical protein